MRVPCRGVLARENISVPNPNLVRRYFQGYTDLVWDAAICDVPNLKPAIEHLLATLDQTAAAPKVEIGGAN
jgi:hypothetical protein